ncbi:TPA: hypothetical protein QCW42_004009 [Bacillus cereus]|nr:hypothetical protein [Bacillus cereus]
MKKGLELFEEVFGEEITIEEVRGEEVEGVEISYENEFHNGWWIYQDVIVDYKGKKYSFEYREHSSDNCCDNDCYINTFMEIKKSYKLELSEDEYNLIRWMCEGSYYSAKDDGNEEKMKDVNRLENKLIELYLK